MTLAKPLDSQRIDDRGSDLAWVLLEGLGHLQCDVAGQIAVRLHLALGVQRRLEIEHVEAHTEGRQIQVLLVAQVGHRKAADVLQVLGVAAGSHRRAVARGLRLARQELARNVGDVVALVTHRLLVDARALQLAQAQLHRAGERVDLHAGVVVVELASHLPALGGEQVGQRIAERCLARVAHVQRAGRIGRDELHHDAPAGVRGRGAEAVALVQHLAHHRLLGAGGQPQVDLTRSASTIAVATSRGFFLRALATCSATLQARSPCACTLGRSSSTAAAGAPMPASA